MRGKPADARCEGHVDARAAVLGNTRGALPNAPPSTWRSSSETSRGARAAPSGASVLANGHACSECWYRWTVVSEVGRCLEPGRGGKGGARPLDVGEGNGAT